METVERLAAFAGAEGGGAYTPGGRGGQVIKVTNLNNSGPGSFREACLAEGPKIIVFEVSGTITLNSTVRLTSPYVTIAGETAFREGGQGITLRGHKFRIATHDVVVRFLRFRTGNENCHEPRDFNNMDSVLLVNRPDDETDQDSFVYNIIFDHCSISWSVSENVSLYSYPKQVFANLRNITLQWCIISEGLSHAGHKDGEHSKGLQLDNYTQDISVHHCLLAHNTNCSPHIKGLGLEYINNVVYNWGQTAVNFRADQNDGEAACQANIIGNTFIPGPDTQTDTYSIIVSHPQTPHQIYMADNLGNGDDGHGQPTPHAAGWRLVGSTSSVDNPAPEHLQANAPHEIDGLGITVQPRSAAYDDTLKLVGASLYRDAVDQRVVDDVTNKTGQIIDHPNEVGGWPELKNFTPLVDSDGDGMPDEWEIAHGLDPNGGPDDAHGYDLNPYYTNLEVYLNELAGDPALMGSDVQDVTPSPGFDMSPPETEVTPPETEPVLLEPQEDWVQEVAELRLSLENYSQSLAAFDELIKMTITPTQEGLGQDVGQLQTELDQLETSVGSLKDFNVTTVVPKQTVLTQQVEAMQERIVTIETRVTGLDGITTNTLIPTQARLSEDFGALQQRVSQLEVKVQALVDDQSNQALETTITALQTRLVQLEGSVAGINARLQDLSGASPVLWSADHETGDLSQWEAKQGEAVFNSNTPPGTSDVRISTDFAHSGSYSLKLSLTGATNNSSQGARVFRRWLDSEVDPPVPLPDEAYYSAWYYFPQRYVPDEWWNVFQFKSRGDASLAMFSFNIGNLASGEMYLYVWDKANNGIAHGQLGTPLPMPVGRWVHIEAYLKKRYSLTGQLIVWQDGVKIIEAQNIRTIRNEDDRLHWAVNNYSNGITPSNPVIYVDDAVISTERVGGN